MLVPARLVASSILPLRLSSWPGVQVSSVQYRGLVAFSVRIRRCSVDRCLVPGPLELFRRGFPPSRWVYLLRVEVVDRNIESTEEEREDQEEDEEERFVDHSELDLGHWRIYADSLRGGLLLSLERRRGRVLQGVVGDIGEVDTFVVFP
ncbi:unnamed protein product [Calypogeia fissa]